MKSGQCCQATPAFTLPHVLVHHPAGKQSCFPATHEHLTPASATNCQCNSFFNKGRQSADTMMCDANLARWTSK